VSAIADWIKQISWEGPGVTSDELIVTGHSNGGMHSLDRLPDSVVIADIEQVRAHGISPLISQTTSLQ
jgi:hypothetical protein